MRKRNSIEFTFIELYANALELRMEILYSKKTKNTFFELKRNLIQSKKFNLY